MVRRCKLGFLYVLALIKWETNAMESSVNDEIEDGGSLLNQVNTGPFSVIAKALHRRVLILVQLHLVLICIEVIYGVFRSVKRFDLWHSELYQKREVQHLGYEQGFSLLHQSVHRD